jgi:hypothetical protein
MGVVQRLSALFRPRRYDQDLDEELRAHIEMRTEELAAGGLPRDEARRRAQMAFGNAACVKEDTRAADTVRFLETLWQDVRYGLRQLGRNPGFTLAATLTLALGIGGNTAIFTAVNGVLLKAPPYAKPDRLIAFRSSHSLPDAEDIGRMAQSLSAVGSFAAWPLDLVSEGPPRRIDSALVGGDLFRVFGVAPHLGSVFSAADDAARKPVVVASYEFWQSHLGGEPSAIGRTIRLSGNSYTLTGVMPKSFHLPNSTSQLWIPFRVGYPEAANARGAHFMFAVGRLRDGVSLAQLNSELEAIGKRLAETHPEEARTFSAMGLRERFAPREGYPAA